MSMLTVASLPYSRKNISGYAVKLDELWLTLELLEPCDRELVSGGAEEIVGVDAVDTGAEAGGDDCTGAGGAGGSKIRFTTAFTSAIVVRVCREA